MNLVNVIGVSLYLVGAVLLALSLVFAMGLALQTEGRYGKYLLPGVLPIIGFGVAVSTILGGRNLALANFDPSGMSIDMQTGGEGTPLAATWPLRLATLYILAASFALILAYLFRRNTKPQSGRVLMLTFAFFFLSNVVAPAILGTKPNFVLNHYYPLVVFLAAFATRNRLASLNSTVLANSMLTAKRWARSIGAGFLVAIVCCCLSRPRNKHQWSDGSQAAGGALRIRRE